MFNLAAEARYKQPSHTWHWFGAMHTGMKMWISGVRNTKQKLLYPFYRKGIFDIRLALSHEAGCKTCVFCLAKSSTSPKAFFERGRPRKPTGAPNRQRQLLLLPQRRHPTEPWLILQHVREESLPAVLGRVSSFSPLFAQDGHEQRQPSVADGAADLNGGPKAWPPFSYFRRQGQQSL